jgi:hypothetical protein
LNRRQKRFDRFATTRTIEIMKAVAAHIKIDDQGVAWIGGANTKVIEARALEQ